jgi:hypothetical protein
LFYWRPIAEDLHQFELLDMEVRLSRRVEEEPIISVRSITGAEDMGDPLFWTILHEESLYPYHLQ